MPGAVQFLGPCEQIVGVRRQEGRRIGLGRGGPAFGGDADGVGQRRARD